MSDEKAAKEKVTFSGYGMIWDEKSGKELCQFSGSQRDSRPPRPGKFTTDNQDIIKKLKALGYKAVQDIEEDNE